MRLAEIEERTADIQTHGATYIKIDLIEVPGEDGKPITKAQKTIKANPAVAQRSEAMRHAQSLLAEFGLSAASRPKISAPAKADQANGWESLVNG
jgi:P27 family predicted phage terminase small subunit